MFGKSIGAGLNRCKSNHLSKIKAIESHLQHMDNELHYCRNCMGAAVEKIDYQKEQNECLKKRVLLCEAILTNLLAKNVNCIAGWDHYLDRLEDIRSTES